MADEADEFSVRHEAAEELKRLAAHPGEEVTRLEHEALEGRSAASLLIIEKLPELVAEQVKAIQNLQIDKITVWDSGMQSADGDGQAQGSTARFLRSLIGSLPPIHDLARQAGIDLPQVLGEVSDGASEVHSGSNSPPARAHGIGTFPAAK